MRQESSDGGVHEVDLLSEQVGLRPRLGKASPSVLLSPVTWDVSFRRTISPRKKPSGEASLSRELKRDSVLENWFVMPASDTELLPIQSPGKRVGTGGSAPHNLMLVSSHGLGRRVGAL